MSTNVSLHRSISEAEVFRYFGSTYGGRGDIYQRQKRVLSVVVSEGGQRLVGKVQGSGSEPYTVDVRLTDNQLKVASCICSCRLGGFCEHSAAAILEVLRKDRYAGDPRVTFVASAPNQRTGSQSVTPVAAGKDAKLLTAIAPQPIASVAVYESKSSGQPSPPPAAAHSGLQPLSKKTAAWLSELKQNLQGGENHRTETENVERVVYVLHVSQAGAKLLLASVSIARKTKQAGWKYVRPAHMHALASGSAAYISEDDKAIANLFLGSSRGSTWADRGEFPSMAEIFKLMVERLVATNRCFWQAHTGAPLAMGGQKEATLKWFCEADGKQMLRLVPQDDGLITVFGGGAAWYVDTTGSTIGELHVPVPLNMLGAILNAPAVEPPEAAALSQELKSLGLSIPPPQEMVVEVIASAPAACLSLTTMDLGIFDAHLFQATGYSYGSQVPVARLSFDYGGCLIEQGKQELRRFFDGKIEIRKRHARFESDCLNRLQKAGLWRKSRAHEPYDAFLFHRQRENEWYQFAKAVLPQLERDGWRVVISNSFPFQVVVPEEEWEVDATEGSDFWFSMRLDITVDGKKHPLLPIIHEAIKHIKGNNAAAEIQALNNHGTFYAPLPDGRQVALEFDRVKVIIETLVELFNKDYRSKKGGRFDIAMPQAVGLLDRLDGPGYNWNAPARLKELLRKFQEYKGPRALVPPKTFHAELRPYQKDALGWLDFIRDLELGGILADDMGLGKTVQTLAHFAIEKHEKRQTKPFLVVCPTSVLPNWLSEIRKFTPAMKVTALWGAERSQHFGKIAKSDIVLTTYPLLVRDQEVLQSQPWQAVVLDEAQMVKNAETLAAQAVRKLDCDYRFCLTGTPVENHLGELWSQFDFLMPGFLGDYSAFKTNFRTPVEKLKNVFVQQALASRVKPFLLRRTKELVAKELPEKSVILRKIELEGDQRDLYETVRVAMYEKVKEALATKGIAKSQIIVLDALLKLRQVCCDPRLVALPAAKKVKSSAKLESLLETLDELLSEGRKILLFSQFTSMLDLIIPELHERKIKFVQLRGDTRDRETPVREFQSNKAPLFLLSLKAGGLGLNLTAADTVIHYDPWWNPAVENQATDRAHRIGQKQKVFVFKMIAAGTIEERMLELQERKRAIAAGIYTEQSDKVASILTAAEIEALFSELTPRK